MTTGTLSPTDRAFITVHVPGMEELNCMIPLSNSVCDLDEEDRRAIGLEILDLANGALELLLNTKPWPVEDADNPTRL